MSLLAKLRSAFHAVDGPRPWRWRHRNEVRILTYHRLPDWSAPILDQQCAHLRRHYRILSLSELLGYWERGETPPPSSVAITIDDGFRDTWETAFPVFARHRIPAMIYLIEDLVERGQWMWWNVAEYCSWESGEAEMDTSGEPWTGLGRMELGDKSNRGRRQQVADAVCQWLKQFPDRKMRELVVELPRRMGVELPERPTADFAPLNWEQIRQMRAAGIEFGAHTVTHPILTQVSDQGVFDEGRCYEEIAGSKRWLEDRLQSEVKHFCYPNGNHDAQVVEMVRRAGFRSAVTCVPAPVNRRRQERFLELERLSVGVDNYPLHYFSEVVSGMR